MTGTSSPVPDLATIKGRQQQVWASGDYHRIGCSFVLDSELLCEAVNLEAGQRVLDVAGGSGNAALAAARRFGDVICTDYVPELLELARVRAEAEELRVKIQEADAENLPFPDGSFDVVLSTFGAMFAPNQERVARELLRVCRSGGKIGMTNWSPDGFAGEFFRTTAQHVPPPPGLKSPLRWGTEDGLRELFGDGIRELTVTRRQHIYRFQSPEHYVDYFRTYYGPTERAFDTLDSSGQEQLTTALADVIRRYTRQGEATAIWPGEYVEVVAVRA
jgi:ubiquinone/menaquinone biosynthesis C-methylase UbiE